MKQALGVYLMLVLVAVAAASVRTSLLDTVQRDDELKVACPPGWNLLYLDSDHANPTCIYLSMQAKSGYATAKQRCTLLDAWLAEPEGWLHHEVYQRIYVLGYQEEAFWIGGSDQAAEGVWIWERTGKPMPMGTPHWEHCNVRQPIPNDRNSNNACIWPNTGAYYFFSCRNDSIIRTMCQKYPTAVAAAPPQ